MTVDCPFTVILNSFQDPSCPATLSVRAEKWTLKQVQGDELSGLGADDFLPSRLREGLGVGQSARDLPGPPPGPLPQAGGGE